LYGTAGYLYSLFLIKKHCEIFLSESFKELNTVILDVVRHLHKEGLRNMKNFKADFLIWPWPKKSTKKLSEVYLGAAHGVIGVLYMMIQSLVSLGVNNSQKSNEDEFFEIISNIKNTLDNLALLRFASGNFPSSLNNERDQLVHFCHGETGAIPLYLLAYEFFKNNYYLEIALKSGEDLWERGILLKGNGLCHGISGGAYSLFSIYKKTQDTTWRTRAFLFAMATFDEDVQELCRNYKDPQRLSKGIPDSPYSLMEGEAGTISLYSDLLNEDEYVIFPGYEI
jgi:lantibiotic modifying enzyme